MTDTQVRDAYVIAFEAIVNRFGGNSEDLRAKLKQLNAMPEAQIVQAVGARKREFGGNTVPRKVKVG